MIKRKPRNVKALAAVAAGLLALAAFGWFVLVSPQRTRSAELADEISATRQQLLDARRTVRRQPPTTRVDELFRLTKAMPDDPDMPGILLELSQIAADTGISFDSISPSDPAPASTYRTQPVSLVFRGNFYELSDFLYRLRSLVAVRDGRLDVDGRLYSVDTINFAESEDERDLQATITANAYIYGTGAAPAAGTTPPASPSAAPATTGAAG